MNAMNWVDGMDGVSGVITLVAIITIFFLSLKPEVNQPPIGIVTAALAGSLVAFLIYNYNPARIMAGTSGSMFMGFILAVLAIFAGAKIATTLMVLAIPIIDALWVLGERIYLKKSIFEADQRHLHFRLLKIGWSVRKIFLFYFLTTSVIAVLALRMRSIGKIATMLIFALFLVLILLYLARKVSSENEKYN
ncbi:MAG: undecaprenyl-phosphate alpha-N-acetylglucosaminyltransferase [uncultured bacterium]|nr:MAG: undecaprenyl-phosphate alpha-N-acetylglucosaminyltransferase [uncultured bacterium]